MPVYDKDKIELSFSRLEIAMMIQKVTEYDENAFLIGCGRDTMERKFYEVFKIFFGKGNVRKMLDSMAECGVMKKIKEKGKCTRFLPR